MDIFGKIRSNRSSMPEVDLSQGRSIAYSHSTTTRLMDVLDANGRGNVHGGVIMRVVDESAAIVAIKHASSQVIYVALDENGRPTPVPPLVPSSAEEEARIARARARREHMKKIEEELAKMQGEDGQA